MVLGVLFYWFSSKRSLAVGQKKLFASGAEKATQLQLLLHWGSIRPSSQITQEFCYY